MIGRVVLGIDRLVTALLALLVLAAAVFVGVWRYDWESRLPGVADVLRQPDYLDFTRLETVLGEPWWPWATGGAALALGLLGLWWLLAHLPHRVGSRQALSGTSEVGRLSVDLAPLGRAVATELEEVPGIAGASSTVTGVRGRKVVEVAVTADPGVRLDRAVSAVERGCADLRTALAGDAPPIRTVVRVGKQSGPGRRVR